MERGGAAVTPAARIAAAADLLDVILAGEAAERSLSRWARASRYAGSRDREAVRDLVFGALRRRRSLAALGGVDTGRGLMIGALRDAGIDPGTIFDGQGYGPAPLSDTERAPGPDPLPAAVALDCPDWLLPRFRASLGRRAQDVLLALRDRAPVGLRVNLRKTDRAAAASSLAAEDIATEPSPLSHTALVVTRNARVLQRSAAYADGRVELQDAASQAVSDLIPVPHGARVLDYCAGGGGKTLALAARAEAAFCAHDAIPARMRDLPSRAARAGVAVRLLSTPDLGRKAPFDVVVVDAPCSGSGAWRRTPEAKWTLTEARLAELAAAQRRILGDAAALVRPGGVLAYITCSLLAEENGAVVDAFLSRRTGWRRGAERQLTPLDGGDGFYVAILAAPG